MNLIIIVMISLLAFACGQETAERSTTGESDPGAADAAPAETPQKQSSDNAAQDEKTDETGNSEDGAEKKTADVKVASFPCPKYPMIFHHGFMSGGRIGGFRGMKDLFTKNGCAYLETEVASVQTAAYRAEQFKTQVEAFLKKTGAAKVNIVAHSQGGLDARYAISKLGLAAQVASLSTMGTPHRGTAIADTALDSTGPLAQKALSLMLNLMGRTINSNTQEPDTMAAVASLTEKNMITFNAEVQDAPTVYYQSWSGQTGAGTKDSMKTLLILSHSILTAKSGANDGVVPVSSAQWGNYRGTLDADHMDQIGYKLLDFRSPFDPADFYSKLARELSEKGF